jgi:hypothetical protein
LPQEGKPLSYTWEFREEEFSEIGLPVLEILGNWSSGVSDFLENSKSLFSLLFQLL